MKENTDILILHGMSEDVVKYLEDLFRSLGISATTVSKQASGKRAQDKRVDESIRQCRMAVVLMTFNEEEPGTENARPNIYDEIARCRALKKDETLLLQEERKGKLVRLPSNVVGQMVVITFESKRIHLMLPRLLTELRGRGFFAVPTVGESKVEAGHILNRFLDQMDKLWDYEFDPAWDKVHRKDYKAERKFAVGLDRFFQEYQRVFSALIRDRKSGVELQVVCDRSYQESVELVVRAWELVADAKMAKIDELSEENQGGTKRQKDLYDKIANALKNAPRQNNAGDKIQEFKTAIQLAEAYFEKDKPHA